MVGIPLIEDKMQENKLRWFGYVYHRLVDAVGRKGDIVMLDGSNNGRGRPK